MNARFGRKILEVLPPLEANKGTAVRRLLADAGLRRALVAGDDTTDLDAFRAVDGLDVAVRVAVAADESPPELRDGADVVVASPQRVRRAAAGAVMHVDDAVLAPVRARFGMPVVLPWQGEISDVEWAVATHNPVRTHDVTLFILDPARTAGAHPQAAVRRGRVAAARRRHHAGRGLRRRRRPRGARGDRAARRAAALPRRDARTVHERGRELHWRTHVFLAETEDTEIAAGDPGEIEDARWGTLAELAGPLRERLLATGRAFWRYRVALHDAAASGLGTRTAVP